MKLIFISTALLLVSACSSTVTPSDSDSKITTSSQSNYLKPGAAVELRYHWLQKPGVGQAGKLQIEFVGNGIKDGLSVNVKADNGLQLNGTGRDVAWQTSKAQSVAAPQQLEVMLSSNELAYINVFVETGSGENKRSRAFAIAVGDASQAQKPHPNLVTEHDGNKVIEMPADSH